MTFPTSLSLNLFLCRMSKLFSTLRYLMVLASDFSYYGRVYVKLSILTIFNCTVQRQQYIFRIFSSPQTETPYPLNSNSGFPSPPAPGNSYSTFCLQKFVCSRYPLQIESLIKESYLSFSCPIYFTQCVFEVYVVASARIS